MSQQLIERDISDEAERHIVMYASLGTNPVTGEPLTETAVHII